MFAHLATLRLPRENQADVAAATPLDFPQYVPEAPPLRPAEVSADEFYARYRSITKPRDVQRHHLDGLNIQMQRDVSPDDLIPKTAGVPRGYLPPPEWDQPEGGRTVLPFPIVLASGRETPSEDVYRSRKGDLNLHTEDAFRTVERVSPREGKGRVKLGYYYKFWSSLDFLAQYWDADADYDDDDENNRHDNDASRPIGGEPTDLSPTLDSNGNKTLGKGGRRMCSGTDMPEEFREDCVRAFVEPITWLFGCQISTPRQPPRLAIRSSLFYLRICSYVFRSSSDRIKARQGQVEGPVMVISARGDTCFRGPSEPVGSGQAEMVDLLREVSTMLLIAQERARERKPEVRPGFGKWYTTVPRWGGGRGGEVDNPIDNTDNAMAAADIGGGGGGGGGESEAPASKRLKEDKPFVEKQAFLERARSRKQMAADAYRRLEPGSGLRDPKVTYLSIGRGKDCEFDDIFMVSSINHHISILRMTIHISYLDFIESGRKPPPLFPTLQAEQARDSKPTWDTLQLKRSRWYNLFSAKDRVEAMRALWAVMGYLTRDLDDADVPFRP